MSARNRDLRRALRLVLVDTTRAERRVSANRTEHIHDQELPAIVVNSLDEESFVYNDSPRVYRREARFGVDCYAAEYTDANGERVNVIDALDNLLQEVEDVLLPRLSPEGLGVDFDVDAAATRLGRVDYGGEEEGKDLSHAARLELVLAYYTEVDEGDAVAPLSDLKRADTEWRLQPPDTDPHAEDETDLS